MPQCWCGVAWEKRFCHDFLSFGPLKVRQAPLESSEFDLFIWLARLWQKVAEAAAITSSVIISDNSRNQCAGVDRINLTGCLAISVCKRRSSLVVSRTLFRSGGG